MHIHEIRGISSVFHSFTVLSDSTRILIVRFSSIGDIVLTTPIIRALKKQLDGEVEIDLITKTSFASIVQSNPHINEVITIEKSVFEVDDRLKAKHYDYVVDLHSNIRSRQVKRIIKALDFTVSKRNLAKWIYVNTKKEWLTIEHFVKRCFDAVSPLGIVDDRQGLDYFIPENDRVDLSVLPTHFASGYIAYAIGGQMPGKILPTEKIIALCQKINAPILLLGGSEDADRGQAIADQVGPSVWNGCGQFNLNQSASLIDQAKCVISHDTGLMHIAAALKKKVISLWFATTPQIGFAPWMPGEGSVMIEADCKKRPTSKLGNRGYEDGCVFNINLDSIAEAVND